MIKRVPIVMPQMGQSVAEGTVIAWKKQVGDQVQADDILLEIETDKTNAEIESPATGVLATCLKQAGERAATGETIGLLEVEAPDEAGAEPAPAPASTAPAAPRPPAAPPRPIRLPNHHELPEINRDLFSPFVLRLAMMNDLSMQELNTITGTGRGGRVTKTDLLHYLARRPIGAASVRAEIGKDDLTPRDLESLGRVLPMSSIRRTIADHMVQSVHTSAHVTMVHLVDVTHLVGLRDRIKKDFEARFRTKLTYTGMLLFVTSRVLRDFPSINASLVGTNLVQRRDINIGCAVALPDESLVVPVVQHADQKSFPEIAQELGRLILLARQRELTRTDVEFGTFTISNFGSFGSIIGTPIINQPQVAILGMGAVVKAPVVVNGEIVIRDQLYLSFSFDHRVIDGAMGGRFLDAIRQATEALTEEALNLETLNGESRH